MGDQAESIVFYELEKQFLLRPALSWNGFQLGSVFKVAKEAVKEERTKRREQNLHVLDVPLSKIELDLYGLLGHDDTELTEQVDGIMANLFFQTVMDEIDEATLKKNMDKSLISNENKWICKLLLGKIANIFKTQNIERNLSNKEIHSFVMNKMFDKKVNKNQEFDQLIIDKKSSTVMQVEIKSVERNENNYNDKGLRGEYKKACEQIRLGRDLFLQVLAPNSNLSTKWGYQGNSS